MLGPSLLAYVGLGAGLELMPYFLALLAWCATALGMVLLWPATALYRRLRTRRGARESADKSPDKNAGENAAEPTRQAADPTPSGNEPLSVGGPASPGDNHHGAS